MSSFWREVLADMSRYAAVVAAGLPFAVLYGIAKASGLDTPVITVAMLLTALATAEFVWRRIASRSTAERRITISLPVASQVIDIRRFESILSGSLRAQLGDVNFVAVSVPHHSTMITEAQFLELMRGQQFSTVTSSLPPQLDVEHFAPKHVWWQHDRPGLLYQDQPARPTSPFVLQQQPA